MTRPIRVIRDSRNLRNSTGGVSHSTGVPATTGTHCPQIFYSRPVISVKA